MGRDEALVEPYRTLGPQIVGLSWCYNRHEISPEPVTDLNGRTIRPRNRDEYVDQSPRLCCFAADVADQPCDFDVSCNDTQSR